MSKQLISTSKILSPKELLAFYKGQADRLLPNPEYNKMVPHSEQMAEIQHLKETIHYERFFFVVNLHKMEIEHVNGVQRWLGYDEKSFNFFKYLSLIHPEHCPAHNITSVTLIEGLMRGDWDIEFMKHRYITEMALRHSDGRYLLCKRLACIFQYDERRRLLEFVNEFTVLREYNSDPFTVRATSDDGKDLEWLNEFLARAQKAFQDKNMFGFQELRILRKYAYNDSISASEIANAFKIQESTVVTYNKRILEKAESLYCKRFANARQVAMVLREAGMV
ncbi:MAG: hypothetical protein QM594_13755 [Niabella sp.]